MTQTLQKSKQALEIERAIELALEGIFPNTEMRLEQMNVSFGPGLSRDYLDAGALELRVLMLPKVAYDVPTDREERDAAPIDINYLEGKN